MKAKDGILDLLNRVLTENLTAINQYFIHAKMCENWGYEGLHDHVRKRSIDEMKDADEIMSISCTWTGCRTCSASEQSKWAKP